MEDLQPKAHLHPTKSKRNQQNLSVQEQMDMEMVRLQAKFGDHSAEYGLPEDRPRKTADITKLLEVLDEAGVAWCLTEDLALNFWGVPKLRTVGFHPAHIFISMLSQRHRTTTYASQQMK
jgi:hypothetical protein